MSVSLEFHEVATVFNNEDAARELLEKLRWPDGVRCPHCEGTVAYKITPKEGSKTRKGLWKCGSKDCRKQFTVTVNTIFEGTRIPLGKWLMALHLICGSKKGISTLALARHLWGDTNDKKQHYKTAWFMAQRIRYAMTQEPLFGKLKGVVEIDETYLGGKWGNMHADKRAKAMQGRKGGTIGKAPVVTLVARDGKIKTRHVEHVNGMNVRAVIRECVDTTAHIMTDESVLYRRWAGSPFRQHDTVFHRGGEYVRGDCHINTSESAHALMKRVIMGTHHHLSKKHLHRYLDEFDFRWNTRKMTDGERTVEAIRMVGGKRLRYAEPAKK